MTKCKKYCPLTEEEHDILKLHYKLTKAGKNDLYEFESADDFIEYLDNRKLFKQEAIGFDKYGNVTYLCIRKKK